MVPGETLSTMQGRRSVVFGPYSDCGFCSCESSLHPPSSLPTFPGSSFGKLLEKQTLAVNQDGTHSSGIELRKELKRLRE